MNFHKLSKVSSVLLLVLTMALTAFAQDREDKGVKSTLVFEDGVNRELPIAMSNNLYCAGYIQRSELDTSKEIVGATEEKDRHIYAEGDELYINAGAVNGVKAGDMFAVIRPRGKVKSKWSKKKSLGHYVQELGAVEVFKVMRDVSVARVKSSCGVILFGDLVTKIPARKSPMFVKRPALEKYAQSSGKASGNIVMARDGVELIGREQIVYLDLGREDSISVGDYMTVYRELGTGNIYGRPHIEGIDNKAAGYESDRYRGERYSIQSTRKKGAKADGSTVSSKDALSRRPEKLRRVVGELIILNVMEKTATAMIVRNASEIHTGDKVELQ